VKVAESYILQCLNYLAATISLMVSLSNHAQWLCIVNSALGSKNAYRARSQANHFFDRSLRSGCFYIVPKDTIFPNDFRIIRKAKRCVVPIASLRILR
jgi:hypothetical protein